MDIQCTQENFSKGLQIVSRVATTKSSLPILANVLLATEDGQLKLSATDLEMGVTTLVGAKVSGDGAVTLPARLLVDFVANNTDPTLAIGAKENEATIHSDRHQAVLKGMDPSEFPLIPKVESSKSVVLAANAFKRALGEVLFAAAIDDTRPVLNGVLVKISGSKMILVATDSYRLAERQLDLSKKTNFDQSVIIPIRTATELTRMLPDSEEVATITLSDNQLSVRFLTTEVISRLIDGTFPDYTQIIPKEEQASVTVSKDELLRAVKMASFFARDSAHNVRLKVAPPTTFAINAVSAAIGENKATIPAKVSGDELEIAFNAKYLLDALAVIKTESVQLNFSGSDQPGVLFPIGDPGYLSLVMPLRVDA